MNSKDIEIVKVMERGQVTIPKMIRNVLNISPGTKMFVSILDDSNILFSVPNIDVMKKSINSEKYFGFFANRRKTPLTQKEMDKVVRSVVVKKFEKKNVDLS